MIMEDFKSWLKINCRSKNTAVSYFGRIKLFIDKYGENFTQQNLDEYICWLKDNQSIATGDLFKNAFRKYMVYSKTNFELPKIEGVDKRINKYFRQEDLNEYLQSVPSLFADIEKTNIVLKFLFYTGVRRKEFLELKRDKFHFDKKYFEVVQTKSKKDRKVPLDSPIRQEIETFFQRFPETHNAFDTTLAQLQYIIRILNNQLNPKLKLTPHLFRHSCAVYLLMVKKWSLPEVAKVLGHSKLETTQIYCDPDFEDILKKIK